jgi:hypothetical protein
VLPRCSLGDDLDSFVDSVLANKKGVAVEHEDAEEC